MNVLSLEQLLQLHALVIQVIGGAEGLKDLGRLEAAIASQTQHVFGEELYPNLVIKAAAIMRCIIADHPFVDGNKRTAMLASLTLLELNDVGFKFDQSEIEDFAVRIANERLDVPGIALWIETHVCR